MKTNTLYLLFLVFLFVGKGFAQPLDHSYGSLKFKVYKDGKQIDLSDKKWKIIPNNDKYKELDISYKYPDYSQITPKNDTYGAVSSDFYLDIVYKKDTMRIYIPDFTHYNFTIDSIPFRKGIYKIPQYVLLLQGNKMLKNKNYVPNLNGNWNLFTKETYRCYLEKVTFLDSIDEKKTEGWGEIFTPAKQLYYFSNRLIIKANHKEQHKVYEVKHITDNVFWEKRTNRINPAPITPYIKSLFL